MRSAAEKSETSDEQFARLDREEIIERATTITFERLHQLAQKGYQPDFGMDFTDSIWLSHPSKKFLHKHLILYPSGLVVSVDARSDDFRFYRDDREQFRKFLQQIPRPTLLDRTRDFRMTIVGWILLAVWIGGFVLITNIVLRFFGIK